MNIFELTPINGRKSFGGKCKVIEENGVAKLLSYDTVVAKYNHEEDKMMVDGYFSATTATHINAFLKLYGYETCNKKQLENYATRI